MKSAQYINKKFIKFVKNSNFTFFGQNISTGSCLGGLLKDLKSDKNFNIINTPNCENSLIGFGFGLLMSNLDSIYFVKQQDFILLGIDQLKNTYSMIKNRKFHSSYSIITTITDTGYEGSQSKLHNSHDLSTFLQCPVYDISIKQEIDYVFNRILIKPGFKIINFSNKLLRQNLSSIHNNLDAKIISDSFLKIGNGKDLTIVFNSYSYHYACDINVEAKKNSIKSSMFSITKLNFDNIGKLIDNIKVTQKLIIIDDSLSTNRFSDKLISSLYQNNILLKKYLIINSEADLNYQKPFINKLKINCKKIIDLILND